MSEAGAYLSSSTQLSLSHKDTVFVKQKEAELQLTSSQTSIRPDLGDHFRTLPLRSLPIPDHGDHG
jgi:hypothetical protein